MFCPNCGKEANTPFCPHCGAPLKQTDTNSTSDNASNTGSASTYTSKVPVNHGHPQKKKHSTLGIVSFILSFLGPLAAFGFILAIVDLVKDKKKEYKHGLTIAAIVISILMCYAIGSNKDKDSKPKDSDTGYSVETATEEESKEKESKEKESKEKDSKEPRIDKEVKEVVTGDSNDSKEETIEYVSYSVADMMKELKENALKAQEKYKGQYIEITGKLSNIDSNGKYISLDDPDDMFAIVGVQCFIKSDEQKKAVMEMTTGDIVTLRGKCTSVGEVLGYSLDIDSIGDVSKSTERDDSKTNSKEELQESIKDKEYLVYFGDVRNDKTGKWRYSMYSESDSQETIAVDYYNAFFESNDEIHALINATLKTTACITPLMNGTMLDVTIYEYVDGEEHDAALLFSGEKLAQYQINLDTGDIEKK